MRKHLLIFVAVIAIIGTILFVRKGYGGEQEEIIQEKIELPVEPQFDIETQFIGEDDTFATVLENLGIGYSQMLDILEAASSTYDFTSVRVGQPLRLFKNSENELVKIEYEIDSDDYVIVEFKVDGYEVEKKEIEYEVQIVRQGATIENSMYLDGLEAQVPEEIIMEFAEVFAWTIDFAVQVQKGDNFEVLYEKRSRDGQDAGTGNILAGKFINKGKEYSAYLFENLDGEQAYFSGEGESMIKQFLRAPLEFRRITSGYTYARFDPINGAKTPHLAIDYAAALGTPIMAVGDGTVTFAGWNSQGYGNYVSIRHNDVYSTGYAHMSSFAKGIRSGAGVKQGQIIGYVGSTGWSTGPHLHYEIKKYGKLVNPLEIELPPGDPVPEEKREQFEKTKAELERMF